MFFRKLLILLPLVLSVSSRAATQSSLQYLETRAKQLLEGCRTKAHDGTILYCPDGKAHYAALWTRDFAYMVENAGDLMQLDDVRKGLVYMLQKQRPDGAIPDRVQPDGVAVYVAGPASSPLGEANLDNPMFLVIAVDEYLKLGMRNSERGAGKQNSGEFFRQWSSVLDRAMNWIPRSEFGLVWNNPQKPHSPYGFTDCIGKTGDLCMESLLYWTACQRMEKLHRQFGDKRRAAEYRQRAQLIEKNLKRLLDEETGAFFAAAMDCRQLDIWANAYAMYLKFPLGAKRERVLKFLVEHYDQYVWHGQVRHLLQPEHWQRMLAPIQPERYQNGAYWATASGWLMTALAEKKPALARQVFADLISDFQQGGICECVGPNYRQLESYVVSATNPLSAVRKLKF